MAAIKHKAHPSFFIIMYHVFIGSIIKLLYQVSTAIATVALKALRYIASVVWQLTTHIVVLPCKLLKLAAVAIITINFYKFAKQSTLWLWTKSLLFIKFTAKCIYNIGWWIIHQLALTSLKDLQVSGSKPIVSLGWELYAEFFPRHKLDYWMGDSHITVEIRSWSYNQKQNRLTYVETGTRRHTYVHSPHGITHMVSRIHWWEPVVEQTMQPYTPLHALSKPAEYD